MMDKSVLILTYYSNYADRNLPLLKYVKVNYLGAYIPIDRRLIEPLRKIFSRVFVCDYLRRRTEIGIRAVNQEILDIVRSERPQYVIWTSFYYDVEFSTLDQIRKEGATVVGWFFDDEWRYDDYSQWWAPHLDYVITNAQSAVSKYHALNTRCILAVPSLGSLERKGKTVVDVVEEYDVSFVGSRHYADREEWINALRIHGINVHTFGDGWGRYLSFEEMLDTFAATRINLNLSRCCDDKRGLQIKGRVFDVCLAGGFLLTEYAPGLEQYFEIGREIVCFHDKRQMIEKTQYYLCHEQERRTIASAGYKRAKAQYSCDSVMSRIFGEIEKERATLRKMQPCRGGVRMPAHARQIASNYHYDWAAAAVEMNDWRMWWECFRYSIQWNPGNAKIWRLFYWFMRIRFFQKVKKIVGPEKYEGLRSWWRTARGEKTD